MRDGTPPDSSVGGLRAIKATDSLYESPKDNLAGDILIPAFQAAEEARIVSAYFTSHALAKLAAGLAAYAARETRPLRLLLSPHLTDEDLDAVREGIANPQEVVTAAIEGLLVDTAGQIRSSAIAGHAADCLGYMVANGQAELRFVLMRAGMFHPKQWLLYGGGDWLAVHGSGNVTHHGLFVNGEQMTVDRGWCDGPPAESRIKKMVATFDEYWANDRPGSLTISAPQAVDLIVSKRDRPDPPTVSEFWAAWRVDQEAGLEPELPSGAPAPLYLVERLWRGSVGAGCSPRRVGLYPPLPLC